MSSYSYTSQTQLRQAFKAQIETLDQTDKPLIRQAFCEWLDYLAKSQQISEALASRATLGSLNAPPFDMIDL